MTQSGESGQSTESTSADLAQSVGTSDDWVRDATSVWQETWDQLPDAEKTDKNALAISEEVYQKVQEYAAQLHDEAQKQKANTDSLDQTLEENLAAVKEALADKAAAHASSAGAPSDTASADAGTEEGSMGCAGSSAAPKAGDTGTANP